jgi:DNA-binding transcriptional MerR regulator/methylmalonyl-CoA mutase cobalamin-binding subunit
MRLVSRVKDFTMNRDTPTFNLKAVVQETGIKPDTLRAWERRYGLPEPNRSSGGHRLYSQHDIDTLLWLMGRQNEGMTISRAVDLWRSLESEGRDPLRVPEYTLTDRDTPMMQGEEIKVMRKRWVDACFTFDERSAERTMSQAFAVYPVETVCIEILQLGLQNLGEGWYEGKVSVQQEHFASALAMRRLDSMLGASPLPTRPGRILMACPPGEEHVFGQALLQLLLRRRGWETIYLGSNVPLERLETSIEIMRPHLVILAAQRLTTAAALKEMAEVLHQRRITVAFGGRIFTQMSSLRQRIPGHFLGETISVALDRVEDLVPMPPPTPEPTPLDSVYRLALSDFQVNQLHINARVSQLMQSEPVTTLQLASANFNLAQNIISALQLGDTQLLNTDIEWTRGLHNNHKVNSAILPHYLKTYAKASEEYLSKDSQPIMAWFKSIIEYASSGTLDTHSHNRKGKSGGNGKDSAGSHH